MTLESIINEYGKGKDEKVMQQVTCLLSDFLAKHASADERECLLKKIYRAVAGGHFNKELADAQMVKMYYEDKDGKHSAPYWTEGEAKAVYDANRGKIPQEYNFYDFEVALNMVKSDYWPLLCKWHEAITTNEPCGEWCAKKIVELAVNWLDDPDNPYGTEKVWRYFNG